jgi:hypothetical protein
MKKYRVLSPDGIDMYEDTVYKSREEAEKAFAEWRKRFEQQGFYSTIENGNRLRIPIEDLHEYMEVIEF